MFHHAKAPLPPNKQSSQSIDLALPVGKIHMG